MFTFEWSDQYPNNTGTRTMTHNRGRWCSKFWFLQLLLHSWMREKFGVIYNGSCFPPWSSESYTFIYIYILINIFIIIWIYIIDVFKCEWSDQYPNNTGTPTMTMIHNRGRGCSKFWFLQPLVPSWMWAKFPGIYNGSGLSTMKFWIIMIYIYIHNHMDLNY